MKPFQAGVAVLALSIAGGAGASTIFDVSFTNQSVNFLGQTAPSSGGGTGAAILDDNGLLTITMQGELMADASTVGFVAGSYMDILIGSTFQIMTMNSGSGISPVAASGAYPLSSGNSRITSCGYGALETIFAECTFVDRSVQYLVGPQGYPYNFYSDQSFTLDGGSLNIQTSLFSGTEVSFLSALELTPAQPVEPEPPVVTDPDPVDPEPPIVATVPEPFSLSLLIPGVITLATFGRRKITAA